MPLYISCVYINFMYFGTAAAWHLRLPALAEACEKHSQFPLANFRSNGRFFNRKQYQKAAISTVIPITT